MQIDKSIHVTIIIVNNAAVVLCRNFSPDSNPINIIIICSKMNNITLIISIPVVNRISNIGAIDLYIHILYL